MWIFFSKIWWPFKFNVHFFHFPPLLRESLWKDLPILQLVFKCFIIMCTFTKFSYLKHFFKKSGGCFKMLTIYFSFPQLWPTFAIKLKKRPTIFLHIWNFDFSFTSLQNFMIRKLIKIKCSLLEYVNKILLIVPTLNNIFDKNCEKSYKFCNVFFKSRTFYSHALLLWLHIYNKHYSYFNIAKKMQNVIKSIFFTPCV